MRQSEEMDVCGVQPERIISYVYSTLCCKRIVEFSKRKPNIFDNRKSKPTVLIVLHQNPFPPSESDSYFSLLLVILFQVV